MTAAAASTAAEPKKYRPKRSSISRPSSDATRWHMSKDAVDRSVLDVANWTDLGCIKHLAQLRWGSSKKVTCSHCNASDEHYWSSTERRWKCRSCGKRFSVTSGSVFASHKLSLQAILAGVLIWATGASGVPALQMRRMLDFGGYNTAFTLASKMREGLERGFNTGMVSGVVEIDGSHQSGRRASEKRGRPLTFRTTDPEEAQKDALLTSSARSKKKREEKAAALAAGGREHPEHGAVFPAARRMAITIRQRSGSKGKGAAVTRVGIGLAETPEVVQALVDKYIAKPESILATDTGTAYSKVGKEFQLHVTVNHSEALVNEKGHHVNNAESFGARQDRSEKGIYLNLEPKYLMDYVVETAFREDHRRMPPGKTADRAMHFAMNVGRSMHWTNFTHGKHRDYEILYPENKPAKASGPVKGRSPVSSVNGRPPR
ncbi:IS1595 family transposase [Roseateles sp.]|uniref:IS1595 family transposase n=1 Tax=Roseateles sp. TaxID=1971397 RepID=UPI0025DCA837|nr:IS1595 family transposase [Roseateles sp.]MBV8037348.1 IS1595 family transposase [Roseateles sp.]